MSNIHKRTDAQSTLQRDSSLDEQQCFTHLMPVEVQTLMLGNKKIMPSRWDSLCQKQSVQKARTLGSHGAQSLV